MGKKKKPVHLDERVLLGLLGARETDTRTSANERVIHIDRSWKCGCESRRTIADGDLATWLPCPRHDAILVLSESGADSTAFSGIRTFFDHPNVRRWGLPAFALGAAAAAKGVYEANLFMRRAREAEDASLVDPLTGLYNRRGWERRIDEERKRLMRDVKPAVAVYMLDVDGLKATNDERGHAAGDAILRNVSKVIRDVTREHDVSARLGGDEFAIMTVQSQAAEADLIRARLERGFHSASLSVSIGFAFANSVDTINEAMERADNAMYEAKKGNSAHAVRHR